MPTLTKNNASLKRAASLHEEWPAKRPARSYTSGGDRATTPRARTGEDRSYFRRVNGRWILEIKGNRRYHPDSDSDNCWEDETEYSYEYYSDDDGYDAARWYDDRRASQTAHRYDESSRWSWQPPARRPPARPAVERYRPPPQRPVSRPRVTLKPRKEAPRHDEQEDEKNVEPKRVFFDHVPWRVVEADLRKEFEKCGTITELEIWRRPDGQSAGKGFCEFTTAKATRIAINQLSGRYIFGRSMYVSSYKPAIMEQTKKSVLEDVKDMSRRGGANVDESTELPLVAYRVLFTNASWKTSEGFLRAQFEALGGVTTFGLSRKQDGTSLGKGNCEFETLSQAKRAIEKMDGKLVDGRKIQVVMDTCLSDSPLARVFFHNVKWTTASDDLRKIFEEIGPLKKFELRVKHDGRSLGMGWCEYSKADDAHKAIKLLHKREIDTRPLFVSVYDPVGAKKAFAADQRKEDNGS